MVSQLMQEEIMAKVEWVMTTCGVGNRGEEDTFMKVNRIPGNCSTFVLIISRYRYDYVTNNILTELNTLAVPS